MIQDTRPHDGDTAIRSLGLNELHPHPKNPRLVWRQDVVAQIKGYIVEGGFPSFHAPLVRPKDEGYETVSGHHRIEAAKKAGLVEIPCWVAEMDDYEAYMELVRSNSQGELSPLEIGLHALHAVPPGKGGRGKKGGLAEYADSIGKSNMYVSQVRSAAEVAESVNRKVDFTVLLDKAGHLAAIHKAPEDVWGLLVPRLLESEDEDGDVVKPSWSVKETKVAVAKIGEFPRFEEEPGSLFLPFVPMVERHLQAPEKFAPETVENLDLKARNTLTMIRGYNMIEDIEDWEDEYLEWLGSGTGDYSWKPGELDNKYKSLGKQLDEVKRGLEEGEGSESGPVNVWERGRWQDHIDDLEDGSVSLLLTDPPYGIGYRSNYRKEKHEAIEGDDASAGENLAECLAAFYPKMEANSHVLVFASWRTEAATVQAIEDAGFKVKSRIVWIKNNTGMGDLEGSFAPKHETIVHGVKGKPTVYQRPADVMEESRIDTKRHPTEKPVKLLARLIEATTVDGERVADPYGGVGSTPRAALEKNRTYWATEWDEGYYGRGKKRLEAPGVPGAEEARR